jgi:hypothetical protein
MSEKSGHWFCSFCDDVKFYPAPADVNADVMDECLTCRNKSLKWVKHVLSRRGKVSAMEAETLFQTMREGVQS